MALQYFPLFPTGTFGKFFNQTFAKIDCDSLFQCDSIDRAHNEPEAPRTIPEELKHDFSMNGLMHIGDWYFNRPYLGNNAAKRIWRKGDIDQKIELARKGTLHGMYGST